MKFTLLIIAITVFFMADVYHDGKYVQMLKSGKKYYQMAGIAFAGISIYALFKKDPTNVHGLLQSTTGILKHMPVDHEASAMFAPLIQSMAQGRVVPQVEQTPQYKRMLNSGRQNTKRSVSETKKKFVAANQSWTCGECKKSLPAWFEVDHITRLDQGGSNHVDNLVALCRDCHGRKTACENL